LANTTITYEAPTWNQIHKILLTQSEKIQKTSYQPDIIVGIAQGGTIPARILTDLLKPAQTTTIKIKFYTDIAQPSTHPTLKQPLTIPVNGKKILIVDDISDSGQTLNLAKQHLTEKGAAETKTAVLYTKTTTQTPPDYAGKITNPWVVFPWEINETLQSILQKYKKDPQTANNAFAQLVNAGVPKLVLKRILKTLQEPYFDTAFF
jgi:hypoxanthine phosphoribosyltransferase